MATRDDDTFISTPTRQDHSLDPGFGMEGSGEEDFFRTVLSFVRQRAWIIGAAVLLGIVVALLVNHFSDRLFTAQASIEVQSQDISSQFRLEQVQGLGADLDTAERLDTEIEILRSKNLALETIRTLHLQNSPDFYPLENGHPWDLSKPEVREKLIRGFKEIVQVSRLGHTQIIQIQATSPNPELSALITNTLIDRYVEYSFRENYAATTKVSSWLNDKLGALKSKLEQSQTHILELQKDVGVYGIDQSHSVVAANLEELNKQYADAEVDRLVKESRLREINSSTPDVLDATLGASDPTLIAIKQRLSQLNDEYTAVAHTYGGAYPRVKALKEQIDQLQRELSQEEKAQFTRAQKEFNAAKNNETMLLAALKKHEEDVFGKSEKALEYELARSDYETNRLLYNGLQQRLQEAGIMSGLHSTAIHTIDTADIPPKPSQPRTRFNLALGIGTGFLIGLALALLLEVMDTNLKSMADIEQDLQLPLLAAIPDVSAEHLSPSNFREHAIVSGASSWSRIGEALRGMRTSILLSSPGAPPKVVMFVSTRPSEGKTSMAALTSITLALNGSKVLLIDADLRRPTIHLRFRLGKGAGLSSALSGKASLQDVAVVWTELANLHVVTSGPVPPLPSELLSSSQMEELLAQARATYDFVVIDTPPALAVTDAAVLGRLVDGAILVVRYDSVTKQVARRCIEILERSGTRFLGAAVNAVNYTAPEYSDYYGNKYSDYYSESKSE